MSDGLCLTCQHLALQSKAHILRFAENVFKLGRQCANANIDFSVENQSKQGRHTLLKCNSENTFTFAEYPEAILVIHLIYLRFNVISKKPYVFKSIGP